MPKILHTARYVDEPWRILKSVTPNGFEVKTLDEPTHEQLIREAGDADYFLVSGRLTIDEEVLSVAKKLKMIQRTGVGIEMLDKESIKARNIPVYVNAGVNARSVAEHALTLMLSCLKRITIIDKQVRNGIWKKQITGVSCHELYGKTVGLVGMGAIGRLVAGYLKCFGAKVLYTDLFRQSDSQEKELGTSFVKSFEELLPQVDILSFHCPLTDTNKGFFNEDAIALMKDGAIVVNTARGKLIDDGALCKALQSGKLRAAGLDVHYEEPITANDPLKNLDNVILSPHIAGLSFESFHTMMEDAIKNIVAFESGNLDSIKDKILKW